MCGNVSQIPDIVHYYHDPTAFKKPPKIYDTNCIVLTEDKHLFMFSNPTQWIEVAQDCYSIGSGSNYALAAMMSGKTPLEAVKIAGKLDIYTGMGYKQYRI